MTIWKNKKIMILTACFCCTLWGSAHSSIKVGYRLFDIDANDSIAQILFAGYRFFLAGILVIIVGSFQQKKLLKPVKADVKPILTLALYQTIFQYVTFYIGLAHATASRAAIINGTAPFISILIAVFVFKFESLTLRKIIGGVLSVAGIVVLETVGQRVSVGFSWKGEGLVMLTVLAAAISANYIKLYGKNHNPVLLSGCQFTVGGAVMILISLLAGARLQFTPAGALLLLYLAFVSSAAYTLWGIILKYHPVSSVTVFNSLTPVMGVFLSAVILKEANAVSIITWISLTLVCLGIIIVSTERSEEL